MNATIYSQHKALATENLSGLLPKKHWWIGCFAQQICQDKNCCQIKHFDGLVVNCQIFQVKLCIWLKFSRLLPKFYAIATVVHTQVMLCNNKISLQLYQSKQAHELTYLKYNHPHCKIRGVKVTPWVSQRWVQC